MKLRLLFYSILLLSFQSCVYDFKPDNKAYENRLVVYGLLSNNDAPFMVFISRTAEIDATKYNVETNAVVELIDGKGNFVPLSEIEAGKYSTLVNYKGTIGEKYKLSIRTNDGKRYESDFETLNKPIEIGDLSYEIMEKPTTDIEHPLLGCQFKTNINVNSSEKLLLRYEMDETWQFNMPLVVSDYWDGEKFIPASFAHVCWKHGSINEIYVVNSSDYGSNTISGLPLTFISNQTNRLAVRYCLNVKQYTMSENTYVFWKAQLDNQEQTSLYTKQPYQVVGNIKNVNDPTEVVLGIFEVSGMSSKRIFFSEGIRNVVLGYNWCEYENEPTYNQLIYGYYAYQTRPGVMLVVDEYCANCELSGGNPVKPDFWPN